MNKFAEFLKKHVVALLVLQTIIFAIVILSIFVLGKIINENYYEFLAVKYQVNNIIDLQETPYQNLSDVGTSKYFVISVSSIEKKMNGINLKCALLNTSSINQQQINLKFEFSKTFKDWGNTSNATAEYDIKELDSGRQITFNLFVQNVPVDIRYMKVNVDHALLSSYTQK